MVWLSLVLLVGFTVVLLKATDFVVEGSSHLAERRGWGKFGLGAFLLALSTTLPEMFVGLSAAWGGSPSLSLGNVVGSNIANLSIIVGSAAVISGSIAVMGEYLRRDFIFAFLAGSVPMLLLIDGSLTRLDGVILLLVYGFYIFGVFHHKHAKEMVKDRLSIGVRLWRKISWVGRDGVRNAMAKVMLGLALVLFAAEMVVRLAGTIAVELNVPVFLVGLIVVAVGTSLPELMLGIKGIAKKEVALVFGNLMGSVVSNSTLILGLTVLIAPIKLETGFRPYLVATLAYLAMFWLFWWLTKTKRRLERWEGAVLVAAYLVFAWIEFWRLNGIH